MRKNIACRERTGIRKAYHRLLWSHLKAHPELKDMEVDDVMRNIRMDLYPGEKRKGWVYQAWIKEINIMWWSFYPESGMNLKEVLWGNPLAGKVPQLEDDNPY